MHAVARTVGLHSGSLVVDKDLLEQTFGKFGFESYWGTGEFIVTYWYLNFVSIVTPMQRDLAPIAYIP